ncbi:hypothetical protein GALL_267960 [mine drainage metagenome]|uniref:Response regulatory domain-containing protein n=1 Tax=mine drainage metagenome TaxID=410659 RepID=A0A1J5RGY9_9ZZZZ
MSMIQQIVRGNGCALIISPDAKVLSAYRGQLSALGYTGIACAADAAAALDLAARQAPALVFMHDTLPAAERARLAQALSAACANPPKFIVIDTGTDSTGTAADAPFAAATPLLTSSFHLSKLLQGLDQPTA